MIAITKVKIAHLEEPMDFKALIIATLSFTSICNASMQHEEKSVNKSIPIDLHDVDFRADGMFLMKDYFHEIRLSKLVNEGSDYFAFYRIDYVCGNCRTKYD